MEKKRNSTSICGKKPKMANKPLKTPSHIKPWNHAADSGNTLPSQPFTSSVIAPNDISKKLKSITPGEATPPSPQNNPS